MGDATIAWIKYLTDEEVALLLASLTQAANNGEELWAASRDYSADEPDATNG